MNVPNMKNCTVENSKFDVTYIFITGKKTFKKGSKLGWEYPFLKNKTKNHI